MLRPLSFLSATFFPLLLCAAFGFASCQPVFHRAVSGVVLALAGTAQATAAGKSDHLESRSSIHPGETIATASGSRLDLMLLPGVLVEMNGDTEIEIVALDLVRDGDETIQPMRTRTARIALRRGSIVASVGLAQTESFLHIATASALCTAGPDRTLKVEILPAGARLFGVRGETIARSADGARSLTLPAGAFAVLPAPA